MFTDTHCHLCPGLDDGPRTLDEALAMCQLAWNEGTRIVAVTAHQNERWPLAPEQIISAADQLSAELRELGCDMQLVPVGEVMLSPDTMELYRAGRLLTVGNHGRYLLVEFPHGLFLDIRNLVSELAAEDVRVILAHAERYPELLHGSGVVDELIRMGCVVQVNTDSLASPRTRADGRALRAWARRGVIHIIGSDAHSAVRRPPQMQAAFQQLSRWTSPSAAHEIFYTNGATILESHLSLQQK